MISWPLVKCLLIGHNWIPCQRTAKGTEWLCERCCMRVLIEGLEPLKETACNDTQERDCEPAS